MQLSAKLRQGRKQFRRRFFSAKLALGNEHYIVSFSSTLFYY